MSLSVIPPEKRDLVKRLCAKNVTKVMFGKGTISLSFDGKTLRNRVVMRKSVPWVGHWSRTSKTIYYDDDLRKFPKEIISLAVHETVEKYLRERYGLSDRAEGHYVAEHVEKKFANRTGVNWDQYLWRAEFIHRKEMEKAKRNGRRMW